jgi:hypothetical protein
MNCEDVILQDGEMICDKCEGTGETGTSWVSCGKCLGMGKVDWIENAMGGKKPPDLTFFASSSGFSNMVNTAINIKTESLIINDKPIDKYIQEVALNYLSEKIDKILLEKIGNAYATYGTQYKKEPT